MKLTVVGGPPSGSYLDRLRQLVSIREDFGVTHLVEDEDDPMGSGRRLYRTHCVHAESHTSSSAGLCHDTARSADELLNEIRPDVVLLLGVPSPELRRLQRLCRRRGIPVIYRADNALLDLRDRMPALEIFSTRRFLTHCSALLAADAKARHVLEDLGGSSERIFFAPDLFGTITASEADQTDEAMNEARSSFGLGRNAPVVLCVGVPRKMLAAALGTTASERPNLQILHDGPGEDARAGLAGRAIYLGHALQSFAAERRRQAYLAADCLILGSAAPRDIAFEGLTLGRPCIVSTDSVNANELVCPGETGEFFEAEDPLSLAAALQRVLRARDSHFDFGAPCRRRARPFNSAEGVRGLAAACQAVLSQREGDGSAQTPRVLAICTSFVMVAGLELATFETLESLISQDIRVHCLLNDWQNFRIVPVAERIGATWSTSHARGVVRRGAGLATILAATYSMLRTSCTTLRVSWRYRPTHVLLSDYWSAIQTAPALCVERALGTRVIHRLHNAPDPSLRHRFLWRRVLNAFVDVFLPNSHFTRRELLAHGVPTQKVTAPIYPIAEQSGERETTAGSRDPGRIVFVGQIIPPKGLHILLDAVGVLVARGYDVRLDVVGQMDGWEHPSYSGYRESVRTRAAQADLAGRVQFLGYLSDVSSVLRRAAVHCCPSLPVTREAFGRVNVEAKRAGIPTVAFATGALPELIAHGQDGWITPEISPEALAEGLGQFVANPELARRAGAAARASAALFVAHDRDWLRALNRATRRDMANSRSSIDGEFPASRAV